MDGCSAEKPGESQTHKTNVQPEFTLTLQTIFGLQPREYEAAPDVSPNDT